MILLFVEQPLQPDPHVKRGGSKGSARTYQFTAIFTSMLFRNGCAVNDQLIAASHSTEEICKMIGADSLGYMQTDYLEGMAGGLPLCKACFDGNYPMEIPDYTNAEFADIVKC